MANDNEVEKIDQYTTSPVSDRIEHLKSMFPETISEGKLDFEKLHEVLGEAVDEQPERYHFTWAGKRDAINLLQTPTRATLVPCHDESTDFNATGNIFIEGDNLEVLKLLYKPYFAQVKAIYIDPPYNTGSDFVYPDNYTDPLDTYLQLTGQKDENGNRLTSNIETHGRFHSAWLTMMYPRLFLARQLLKEDGIIFVSIDDHEVHNLRMLMNEVFGEENILQEIVWQRHAGGGNNGRYFAVDHEYILAYAKNKETLATLKFSLSDEQRAKYTEKDEWHSTLGPYKTLSFSQDRPANPRLGLQYEIELPDGKTVFNQWKWKESRFLEAKEKNQIVFKEDSHGKFQVKYKKYLNNSDRLPRSLLMKEEKNSDGKKQLSALLGTSDILNNPKPVGLIKHLLQFSTTPNSLIVDFFAGSCTTAQAVLELNHEDGGSRRFIMVQLPEPTPEGSIARKAGFNTISDIGKGRIKRVLERMRNGNLLRAAEDYGFRIFNLSQSNYRLWNGIEEDTPESYADQMRLFADCPLMDGWVPENVIYEVAIKEGYKPDILIEPVIRIEKNAISRVISADRKQSFFICLDEELFQQDLDKLRLTIEDLFVCRDLALDDTKAANLGLQCRLKTI